jgi:hypothetical protein
MNSKRKRDRGETGYERFNFTHQATKQVTHLFTEKVSKNLFD